MDHQVSAKLDRLAEVWCGHRIIDNQGTRTPWRSRTAPPCRTRRLQGSPATRTKGFDFVFLVVLFERLRTWSRSSVSTKVQSHPNFCIVFPNCVMDPPYNLFELMMRSPGDISAKRARSCAEWPLLVQVVPRPFSRFAIRSSSTAVVGLERRE